MNLCVQLSGDLLHNLFDYAIYSNQCRYFSCATSSRILSLCHKEVNTVAAAAYSTALNDMILHRLMSLAATEVPL